jgi:hypothetical protein
MWLYFYLWQNLWVSNYYHGILGTSECNVQPPWISQKTNSLIFIWTNTRYYYDVLFSSLKCVDRGNFNRLVDFGMKSTLVLQILNKICPLSFIRCNDSDLFWLNSRLDEPKYNSRSLKRSYLPFLNVNYSCLVTNFSTLAASVLLRYDVPDPAISSCPEET